MVCFFVLDSAAKAKDVTIHGFVTAGKSPTGFEIDHHRITRDNTEPKLKGLTPSFLQLPRDRAVQLDRFVQLPLLDVLTVGVGDVNRSRTEQQRRAPVR